MLPIILHCTSDTALRPPLSLVIEHTASTASFKLNHVLNSVFLEKGMSWAQGDWRLDWRVKKDGIGAMGRVWMAVGAAPVREKLDEHFDWLGWKRKLYSKAGQATVGFLDSWILLSSGG